jgi:hypothetical protein
VIRLPDWRVRLHAYLHEVWHRPFLWSEHDCATFTAGGVLAMTGEDFGAPYRGKYKTLAGGLRMLKKHGFETHADLAASLFEEIHPSMAQVGDLAAVKVDDAGFYALGIVQGSRIYVLRPETAGIGTVDLLDAERAFRV